MTNVPISQAIVTRLLESQIFNARHKVVSSREYNNGYHDFYKF